MPMSDDKLQALSEQLPDRKNLSQPPLHLWHPELSGAIDILIKRDGTWIHEGAAYTASGTGALVREYPAPRRGWRVLPAHPGYDFILKFICDFYKNMRLSINTYLPHTTQIVTLSYLRFYHQIHLRFL